VPALAKSQLREQSGKQRIMFYNLFTSKGELYLYREKIPFQLIPCNEFNLKYNDCPESASLGKQGCQPANV
jgi:hypothetical protein